MFGMPADNVRRVYIEGSGRIGLNRHDDAVADAALLAKAVGRPVRVQWSRADEHGWDPKGPPTLIDLRAAVDGAGVVTAWESEFFIPQQTAGSFNVPLVAATLAGMPAGEDIAPGNIFQNSEIPYKFANVKTICRRLASTPFRPSWIRTPGRMQNTYANECFIDELAAAANADPVEFRLKYLDPNDKRGIEVLNRVAALAKWDKRPSPRRDQRGEVATGRGVAYCKYELTAHLYRGGGRGRGEAVDRRHPSDEILSRPRLRPDHQSGWGAKPTRRQRDPDVDPHLDRGAQIRPLRGDQPRLGELSHPAIPAAAGTRLRSDRSAERASVGRR